MTQFDKYFDEIKQLLTFENYPLLIKRIIDLTLDTEDINQYRETAKLLSWLDKNEKRVDEVKIRLSAILDNLYNKLKSKPLTSDEDARVLVSVENMIKGYDNSPFLLGPISFDIREKQIIGLVGENGNGKTTLLRTLCRELQPTKGMIHYRFNYTDGYDLRSQLAYIPQRTVSCKGLIRTNLEFAASSYGVKAEENELLVELVTTRMGLRKFRDYSWSSLSSGYKMRFELARVLLRKPKILLIDEPLANLDILAQQIVLDDFKDIAHSPFRPLGIILSSQQLYEVEKTSDQVIFLKNGKPRNLVEKHEDVVKEVLPFIVEFESEWSQEQLYDIFKPLGIEKLHINGGTYIANFPADTTQNDFLKTALDNNIPITYFRNISNSTRRFFLS
jgi:ABC-2 type transport system ATP-binding protein